MQKREKLSIIHALVFGVFVQHTWEELSWPLWAMITEGTKEVGGWWGRSSDAAAFLVPCLPANLSLLSGYFGRNRERAEFFIWVDKEGNRTLVGAGIKEKWGNGRNHWEGIIIIGVRLIYLWFIHSLFLPLPSSHPFIHLPIPGTE